MMESPVWWHPALREAEPPRASPSMWPMAAIIRADNGLLSIDKAENG